MGQRNFDRLALDEYMSMQHAANLNMVITVRCSGCKREARYLAADLVEIVGREHFLRNPMWPCRRCGTGDFISNTWAPITAQSPQSGVVVRRPVKKVERWIWRDYALS